MATTYNLIEIEPGFSVATATNDADLFAIPLVGPGFGLTIIHGFDLGVDALRFGRSLGPDGTAIEAVVAIADAASDFASYAESWMDADGDGTRDDLLLLGEANAVILSDLAAQIDFTPVSRFHRGFEIGTGGWIDESRDWFGTATRVASGTDGIASETGDFHLVIEGDDISAPYNNLRERGMIDFEPFTASIEIYLDSTVDGGGWAAGEGFDYSVAASVTDIGALDVYFSLAQDASTGALWVAACLDQNPAFLARTDLEDQPGAVVIEDDGWYSFAHHFRADSAGNLAVDMSVTNGEDEIVFRTTLVTDIAVDTVSGDPRYAFFELVSVTGGIPVDELDVRYDADQVPPLPDLAGLFLA